MNKYHWSRHLWPCSVAFFVLCNISFSTPPHHSYFRPLHRLHLHPPLLSGRCVSGSAFCCWTTDGNICTPSWMWPPGSLLGPQNRQSHNSSLVWRRSGGTSSLPLSGQQSCSPASARDLRLICSEFTWTLQVELPPYLPPPPTPPHYTHLWNST